MPIFPTQLPESQQKFSVSQSMRLEDSCLEKLSNPREKSDHLQIPL